jgi:hypothetical protein
MKLQPLPTIFPPSFAAEISCRNTKPRPPPILPRLLRPSLERLSELQGSRMWRENSPSYRRKDELHPCARRPESWTGAYDPASGTCSTIALMVTGLPTTNRRLRPASVPMRLRMTAPRSRRINFLGPDGPVALRTIASTSGNVRAALFSFPNAFMSGCPIDDSNAATTSRKFSEEVTLKRCTLILSLPSFASISLRSTRLRSDQRAQSATDQWILI